MDSATLVLLGIYHGQSNPDRISIEDIDKLIDLEKKFDKRHGDTDWEESDTDWADSVAKWYNDKRDRNWNKIPMVDDDPHYKIKQEMGHYLSITEDDEFELAINSLKSALKSKKKRTWLIDNLENVPVWDKVQMKFTVEEFCKLIGLTQFVLG